MGFSLESAISLPCCLVILVESIGMAMPLSISTHQSARLSAYASTRYQEGLHSCRYVEEDVKGCKVYRVETEPQKMVESLFFVKDAIHIVGRICPSTDTQDMKNIE